MTVAAGMGWWHDNEHWWNGDKAWFEDDKAAWAAEVHGHWQDEMKDDSKSPYFDWEYKARGKKQKAQQQSWKYGEEYDYYSKWGDKKKEEESWKDCEWWDHSHRGWWGDKSWDEWDGSQDKLWDDKQSWDKWDQQSWDKWYDKQSWDKWDDDDQQSSETTSCDEPAWKKAKWSGKIYPQQPTDPKYIEITNSLNDWFKRERAGSLSNNFPTYKNYNVSSSMQLVQ